MGKKKNNKKRIQKKELSVEYCKRLQKNQATSKKRKKGRPKGTTKKKAIVPTIFVSIDKVGTYFFKSEEGGWGLTEKFFKCLYDTIEDKLTLLERGLLGITWFTGARGCELVEMDFNNLVNCEITFLCKKKQGDDKGTIFRTTPIPPDLIKILEELQDKGITQKGYLIRLDTLGTTKKLDDVLRDLSKRLYLDTLVLKHTKGKTRKLCLHQFRRGRVTALKDAKIIDREQSAKYLGHKDMRTLGRYLRVQSSEFNDFIAQYDLGLSDPTLGSLRVSDIDLLLDRAFERNMSKIKPAIKV